MKPEPERSRRRFNSPAPPASALRLFARLASWSGPALDSGCFSSRGHGFTYRRASDNTHTPTSDGHIANGTTKELLASIDNGVQALRRWRLLEIVLPESHVELCARQA